MKKHKICKDFPLSSSQGRNEPSQTTQIPLFFIKFVLLLEFFAFL